MGAQPRGRGAPARSAPELGGAASFGGNRRGFHRKEQRGRPPAAPPGRNWAAPPSPAPLLAAAAAPPLPATEFQGGPKFRGKREKSPERLGRGRFSPHPRPAAPSLDFPRLLPFLPAASPAPAPPSPGPAGGGGGRGGAAPAGGPALCRSLNASGGNSADRGKFFIRGGNEKKKKKIYISRKRERKRSRERRGKGLILQVKLS